jgi:hypothetical protein
LAVALFFAIDALAFRTGYYPRLLEPNSTAGYLQTYLWIEDHRPKSGSNQVLAMGDSRMGLKARVANALTAETGYTFGTIAVPGTTPRCWYYMLREIDPSANRYAVIVVPLDSYDDRDWEDRRGRELDLNYLSPLLRTADFLPFVLSFPNWEGRAHAAEAILFKGLDYQLDFQDFLARRRTRLEETRLTRQFAHEWYYNAVWERHSLAGMSVDWAARTVRLPDWMPEPKRRETEELLLRDPTPVSSESTAYRRQWLGAIVNRYRGSRTQVLFLRLPRGPVVRPGAAAGATRSTVRNLAVAGHARLAPEHEFDRLERPELFGDALHLNEEGGIEFSAILARLVRRELGPVAEASR